MICNHSSNLKSTYTNIWYPQIYEHIARLLSAITATTISVLLSDATTHEVTLETALIPNQETEVTFIIDEVEYTATVTYVIESLVVESVSAIDKTIELNVASFELEEGATANVAIFALNDEGEKTGNALVSTNNVEIKDYVVTFDISNGTFGNDEYVVEVTIGETTKAVNVTVEFDVVEKLVADINVATTAQLATLLNNEAYFTGFDIALVDTYKQKVTGTLKTVAEVQKEVIDAAAEVSEFVAFTEELLGAEGEYAKYLVLKGQFTNVLDANMDEYLATTGPIFKGDLSTLDDAINSFSDISDAIDVINLDKTVSGLTIVDAKPSTLNQYKSALEGLVLVNDEVADTNNSDTKADWLAAIDAELTEIADAREAAEAEIVKAQGALEAYATAAGEVPAEGDVTEYDAVVTAIEDLEKEDLTKTELATAILTGAVAALEAKTEELTIIDDTLDALAAFAAAFGEGAELETVYTDVTGQFTDFDAEDYSYASDKDIESLKAALATLTAETAEWETYNAVVAATTSTEMRSLLFEFENTDYVNLTSAQKLEFAGLFITAIVEDESANFDAIDTLLGTELTTYKGLIDGVNSATTISEMTDALVVISNAYVELGAQAKADIAEAVLAGVPNYETLAEIEEAIGL